MHNAYGNGKLYCDSSKAALACFENNQHKNNIVLKGAFLFALAI
jgi:hypothetical protein